MADNFTDLTTRTRDWLNRETSAISDAVLQDCIRWAADDAYRTLRIPPLEASQLFTGFGTGDFNILQEPSVGGMRVTSIAVPSDMIELIKIRTTDETGKTIHVVETKTDVRTFFNPEAEMYSTESAWTRKGGRIYLATSIGATSGTSASPAVYVELYYYKRLADLDALYTVRKENFDAWQTYVALAGTQAGAAGTGEGFLLIKDSAGNPVTVEADVWDIGNVAEDTTETTADSSSGIYKFYGKSPSNWLMNENEKLLIYGALAEAFSYLQEDDQAVKYKARFEEEIAQLNDEDVRRNATGGNIQINFNGRGLI